jgi:O-antigen ligase
VLAVLARPKVMPPGMRLLDAALVAAVVFGGAQLVPLPRATRLAIAPAFARVDSDLYLDAASRLWAPISVDRDATIESVALAAAGVLVFLSARTLFSGRTLRRAIRTVAVCGLIASGLAIVQHAVAPSLLYGVWQPTSRGAFPYTPFVNRNDLAGWLILAIPLTLGYLVARIESRRMQAATMPMTSVVDETSAWLAGGVAAMTAALMVSLSRAGLTGGAASAALFVWLSRARTARRGRLALMAGIAILILLGSLYVSRSALLMRLDETLAQGVGSRREIWDTTLAMIRDFPLTGIGVGAYARAVSVYQGPHDFFFNHAHDEYLQILAEGGVGLVAIVAIAVIAGAARAISLLSRDRTPAYWIRAGAVSGALAVAVQSVWETALRMPANAVLFAVCCAAALSAPAGEDRAADAHKKGRS